MEHILRVLQCRDDQIESLQEVVAGREAEIEGLQQDVDDREGELENLQRARKAKGSKGMRKQMNRLQRGWAADHETGQEILNARSAEIEHLRGVLTARDAEIENHCKLGAEWRGALTARDARIQRLVQEMYSLSRGRAAETAPVAKDDAMATRLGLEIERLRHAGKEKEEEIASLSKAGEQAGEQARATEESARGALAAKDAELLRAREECKEQATSLAARTR